METAARVRIGELARRTGVSVELLRAWEQRYGLLSPERSAGGFRLYSAADEARVRRMTALIASGVSASEAAARATNDEPLALSGAATEELGAELRAVLDRFDGEAAHDALDRLLATVSTDVVIADILVPLLHELGDRWEAGRVTVGQEHFASGLIRGRLLGLARGWAGGSGPAFVLACLPGEEHDLGLVMFGLVLARRGARVVFLGADTPVATIAETVSDIGPVGVVIAATRLEPLAAAAPDLSRLAADVPVYVGGAGAEPDAVAQLGGRPLEGDLVAAARVLARRV
jgi:MerR family transcriptional regulator, light-induced transcriptional regulator